jgi:hypothetical protein
MKSPGLRSGFKPAPDSTEKGSVLNRVIGLGIWLLLATGGCNPATREADLVITNANVWTGSGKSAEAVAIVGDRIAFVGGNGAAHRWIGKSTRTIDAGGRRVIPGITDSHLHLLSGGLQRSRLQLRDAASREAFVTTVTDRAERLAPGDWLLGGRWSVESWSDPAPPRKEWIDPVTGNHPCLLHRMDGHQALANSVALRLAGIDADGPPDPPGGVIERDAETHEPTGILKDAAINLVSDLIPPPSEEALLAALQDATRLLHSYGVTSVHDMSDDSDLQVLARAHREGQLKLRVRKYVHVPNWLKHIARAHAFTPNDDMLRVAGFKGYMDGSLGSRTAYMYRPYADAEASWSYPSGILADQATPPKHMRHMIECADDAGLQAAVHAIGDEANHILIDAYDAVARRNPPRDRRHRIEHAQHLLPEDIPRIAAGGITASMQPFHKSDDGRYAEIALGADRLKGSYAFRSLLSAGAVVCFGSDWPVVTCNPFAGIRAAVTAQTLDGKVWIPEESISVEDALRCYTSAPAKAAFQEKRLGTLAPGMLADLAILSQDILTVPPDQIDQTRAAMTILGGEIVFEEPGD